MLYLNRFSRVPGNNSAIKKRIVQKDNCQQYQNRDQSWQTSETSHRDCLLESWEVQEEEKEEMMNIQRKRIREACKRVLRDKKQSKIAKIAQGSALTQR